MPAALLFDLDGTLTNSDVFHFRAMQKALAEHGRDLTEEEFRTRLSGRANRDIEGLLFPEYSPEQQRTFSDRKEALFRELSSELMPLAGLLEVLSWAEEGQAKLALVTNAPKPNVTHMLKALSLAEAFDAIILGDDLPRSKPDPLPYLTGLERLGASAPRALAFEDSVAGVTAAKRAGLVTVGLTTTQEPQTLVDAGATIAVPDFRDERVWKILDQLAAGFPTPA